MTLHVKRVRPLLALSFVVALPVAAIAGPPLVCFPADIGSAASLPWGPGTGWNTPSPSYDRTRVVDDALALLTPTTPVVVRMETLRRATIYASTDATRAARLIEALRARTSAPDALAMFDYGYAIEVMRQAQHSTRIALPVPADSGVVLVERALASRRGDGAMHYAVALMHVGTRAAGAATAHLDAAVAAASHDAQLARTIDAHAELWGRRPVTGAR
ncbi:MAG: hypothetical protein JNM38_18450 [Acidobacteria bacterium]|nr:hypothetical protein [Acidobacteriota bacterium]